MIARMFKPSLVFSLLLLLSGVFYTHAQEAGDVLFEDSFEDSKDLPQWEWDEDYHDFARVATDGENRVLRLTGNDDGANLYSDDSGDWENYALELRVKIVTPANDGDYDFVLVLRDDLDNAASAGAIFASTNSEALIATFHDDEYQEFGSVTHEFNVDEWYNVRFAVSGDRLELSINGEVISQAETDEQGEQGGIGVVAGGNAVVLFDDIRVTALAVENQIAAQFGDVIGAIINGGSADNNDDEAQLEVTATVSVNTANLRGGPSTDFDVVAQARRGDTFEIIAQSGDGDDVWYLISGDVEQWIFSGVVTLEPEDAEIPDIEA